MRSLLSYVSTHPEHAQLIVDVMQQIIGIMETQAAWAVELMLGLEELKLMPFRAHKRKERENPAPPRGPGNRKHRKRAACRLKDKMRAATAAMQGMYVVIVG
ncbi:hypothetical protein GCK32_009686 [Trichostrongylus colubriformis]|uniref:Uncharacterized protein n=1 Tax=Trichostrongylus colubriformis TaxID=6319 RepID=A0AAN8IEH4_TRICO